MGTGRAVGGQGKVAGGPYNPLTAHRSPLTAHRSPLTAVTPPRVYLTGPMGSGKSTVGARLADALGTRFVDLDWLVEARTGRTVAELFAAGERAFRVAEAGALAETTRGEPAVVATGGGTLADAANLRTARAAGAVVWLRPSLDALVVRLGRSHPVRPLLAGPDGRPLAGSALRARVRSILDAREPFYAQADVVVVADGPPDAVAREIAQALRGWRRDG